MEYARQLADLLNQQMKATGNLCGWRFDLHQLQGIDIGIKNNQIGGPYSSPSFKQSISGEIYLVWKDHKFTASKLDSQVVANFTDYFSLWEKTSYVDPEGVGIYTPETVPQVELYDPNIARVVNDNFDRAFELLSQGYTTISNAEVRKVDARVKCYENYRTIQNSDGFNLATTQTAVDFYFIANDCYGEGYGEKKWPEDSEIHQVLDRTITIGKLLEEEVQFEQSGPIRLIFPSETFESFLSHFLVSNLYGSLVVNRQSSFSFENFNNQAPVIRDDLSLTINNLLPYRSFSYRCTAEGVPGEVREFIKEGRLLSPILNLKYAKKTGLKPTALTSGSKGFFLTSSRAMPDWDDYLKQVDRGIIVYSVLGMHTQDSSSGHFSLTADQCLLVENGVIKGKVKAVINGDFFQALQSDESELIRVAGDDNPGFAFWANAINV